MTASPQSGVTLVLGPPNSGKRGIALAWWQERALSRPLLVMPTAPDASEMSAELARRTGGAVGQSEALTFTGLAQAVTGGSRRLVSEFERTALVHGLLRSMRLPSLERVSHLPGVAGAAAKLLQEFEESGKSPREIDEILRSWAGVEPSSGSLAHDLRALVSAYGGRLEASALADEAVLVREAASGLSEWTRPVAFCGFTSFTQGQRALVERLAGATEVLVTLDHDRERGIGLCARREAEWWTRHATQVVDVGPLAPTYASAAVAYLERSLLGISGGDEAPVSEQESEGVRFMLSSGRRTEAESVAEQIAHLVRAGVDPGGIAVVVRQVRTWGRLLGGVFESCGIPHQIDERHRLGETGLGYAFMQAVRGMASDDAEALLAFLASPYSEAAPEEVRDLEAGYRRGAGRGAGALSVLAGRGMVEALEPLRALVPRKSRQLDLAAAKALAERMMLAAARGARPGSRDLEADSRAYRALSDALLVIGAHVSPADTDEVLRLVAQAAVPAAKHQATGVVQVISAQRARARRFDAVFILGLVEGEFPGLADNPSLLEPAHRRRLESLGAGLPVTEAGAERSLFIGAATRAWRLLFLSARDAEDDGSEAMPSRFWTEAKSILGAQGSAPLRRTLAEQVFSADSAPTLRHYLRACAAEGRQQGCEGAAVPPWRRGVAVLEAEQALADFKGTRSFSPSALESYATCPFAWFVDRVVGRQEFEAELDGRAVGDLVHGVLSACYRTLADDGSLPLTSERLPEAWARAEALIDKAVNGPDCPGTVGERRVAGRRLREMVHRLFQAEAEAGGSLVFREAEVRVGGTEGVDIGGLLVRGRVDRIDSTPDGRTIFVFDYKSGAAPPASALGTGDGLQLPLYLLALGGERQDVAVAGGAYLSLSQGTMSGVVASGEEALLGDRAGKCRTLDEAGWQELSHDVLGVAQTAADGIRAGDIAPRPDRVCPKWCDLGPVCRARQGGRRQ